MRNRLRPLLHLILVSGLFLAAGAKTALAAASPNAVRGFVYEWFGLFDRNAPASAFLERLDGADLQVDFPEQRLVSHADFIAWYQGILATFATATHDVKDLNVTPQGDAWQVDLTVEWRAKQLDGGAVQGLFHQVWRVVEREDGTLLIQRNEITPVSSGSARYRRVTTLGEVPAGDDYHLIQPAVESPTLLAGKRIALLTAPGVEDVELTYPLDYFTARGATVDVVAPWWAKGKVLGVDYTKPTFWIDTTKTFAEALTETYDLVVVTGGPWNSGVLRSDAEALTLINRQAASGRLLAPICSGSQVLIDTGLARGKAVTGAPNVRIDLENAGGLYKDQPVVQSGNLITGQDPRALPLFSTTLKDALLAR